jgi:acyl-CoA thioesterase I
MRRKALALLLALVPVACLGHAHPDQPLWKSHFISGDTLLFVRESDHAHASASLLFVPQRTPCLESATREVTYQPGRDFTWKPGSRTIELTARSRIPFKTRAEMYPDLTAQNSIAQSKTHPGKALFFAEGRPFHDMQVVAEYETDERWTGFVPERSGRFLPRTVARLRSRQPIRLVVLGDSISTGANASAFIRDEPFTPAYPQLVTRGLEALGASRVTLMNLSVGGMTSSWGVTRIPEVIVDKPDLLIIAFGMNDALRLDSGGVLPERYAQNMREMISTTRQALPNCEIILVATMLGNPDWYFLEQSRFGAFREVLRKLEGPGVAVADITSFWADLLQRKSFDDLTGNGLNHPNDFGHEVYSQVILQALRSRGMAQSTSYAH